MIGTRGMWMRCVIAWMGGSYPNSFCAQCNLVFESMLVVFDWMNRINRMTAFKVQWVEWKRDRWILPRGRRRTGRGQLCGQDPQR